VISKTVEVEVQRANLSHTAMDKFSTVDHLVDLTRSEQWSLPKSERTTQGVLRLKLDAVMEGVEVMEASWSDWLTACGDKGR
jgi:hypothetical protein